MNAFAEYMLKANAGLCFFLLIYVLLLKRETDFSFNRGYLLSALLFSSLGPLLHFSVPNLLSFNESIREIVLPEVVVRPMAGSVMTGIAAIADWLWIIYLVVIFSLAMDFIIRLIRLLFKIYHTPGIRIGSLCLLESTDDREVFSFFNYVFIGNSLALSSEEKSKIIRHEAIHTAKYHSFDILLVNLLGILFWFNPLMKTYRKLFVQLHEFEADARSVESHEVDDYCDLLAKVALKSSGYQLANHFSNSLTLKRIEMMKKMKTRLGRRKILFVAAAAFAFCYVVVGNKLMLAQVKNDQTSDEKVYTFVEEGASFGSKGDLAELYQFIAKNLRYPEEAKTKGIEGKVFAKFVIEKDGSVTHAEIVKGIGYGMDEETLRVVKMLPKWNPGKDKGKAVRQSFTMPILFQLSEPKKGD